MTTPVVAIRVSDIIAKVQAKEQGAKLRLGTIRTLVVAGIITIGYVNAKHAGSANKQHGLAVAHINWLAEKALEDEGLGLGQRAALYEIIDDLLMEVVDASIPHIKGVETNKDETVN